MKKPFLSLILLTLISCNTSTTENNISNQAGTLLNYNSFPLEVPEENSLMSRWENKKVKAEMMIDNMETDRGWEVNGIGRKSYTSERAKDGKQSLRFTTSLRDEEHYRNNRSDWDSFNGTQGGRTSVTLNFEDPQDWNKYNRISFFVYVHPGSVRTHSLYMSFDCEGVVYNAAYPGRSHHIHDLEEGQWNHVMYEIPHLKRDKVTSITINRMLTGHGPDEQGIVTYDIDELKVQQVDPEKYEGWEAARGKFVFNHIGYRPDDKKVALAGAGIRDEFKIINSAGEEVFSGITKTIETENGIFKKIDFSSLSQPGEYIIQSGELVSDPFPIHSQVWDKPLFNAINFFFCQRCGYDVPGIHPVCHEDWQGFYGDKKLIINGGWHDAGDLSQGSWRTAMATYAMMLHLEDLEKTGREKELAERLRKEIAWGLEWLLKTRFGDGYHMSFSVMRIYTDNEVGTIDDVVTPARNVPWENFLASAVQAKAAQILKNTHPELAERSRLAALEDWKYALNSRETWDEADYLEAAWGATSSLLLEELTNEEKYNDYAWRFGDLLIECQEQTFVEGIPITGYFYTDTERENIIHNHHVSFEEAPLIALTMLCEKFPDHKNWMNWYSAVVLHSEFFMKRGSRIAKPYHHLPNSVWKRSEILEVQDEQRRENMMRQFEESHKFNDNYVLRTFPIYRDNLFHGNTSIQMASTWALAKASKLRRDQEGIDLVQKQLQWVMGANPFGQSLMYGTGYDFAPHFAYCLENIVGSLPVGVDCLHDDVPYWSSTNNATHKEIWVEPVSRFLGALSVYTTETGKSYESEISEQDEISLQTESSLKGHDLKTILMVSGVGKYKLWLKKYNLEGGPEYIDLDLSGSEEIQIDMKLSDPGKPYILLIGQADNINVRSEITGATINF